MTLAMNEPDQLALFTFDQLEAVIERGLKTFVEVGQALMRIRDERLYRQRGYSDFDTYCRERWGWGKAYANHQVRAAQVATIVATPPSNEAQARELTPLLGRPDELADTWQQLREEHGDKVTAQKVREAVTRTLRREERLAASEQAAQTLADAPVELPAGNYPTIVADPPWQYDNAGTRGAADGHYPTMTVEEICKLDVAARAADHAHLYLWTTNTFLLAAFAVLDAWGFEYKTCLTWAKPQIGLGNYFRSATEHVLFGVRGTLPVADRAIPTWFQADRLRHSEKPATFYELVERASPGPYLELFARRPRPGWDAWGNEA